MTSLAVVTASRDPDMNKILIAGPVSVLRRLLAVVLGQPATTARIHGA